MNTVNDVIIDKRNLSGTQLHFDKKANNFDFIRFLAAIGVIFTHSYDLLGFHEQEPFTTLLTYPLSFFSVRVFFIISGYLIARSLLNSASGINYFTNRSLRIFPGLIVVVTLSILVLGPILTTLSVQEYFSSAGTYTYFKNILLYRSQENLPGVFVANDINKYVNGSLWTLAYEFTCYLGLFIIYKLGIVSRKYLFLVTVILLILVEYFVLQSPIAYNYYPSIGLAVSATLDFTIFFLLGTLFYLFEKNIVMTLPLLGLASLVMILSILYMPNYFGKILIYLCLPYIVFATSFIKSIFNKFAKYGDFSYGLYIYAFPVQQTIIYYSPNIGVIQLFFASLIITTILAAFSWFYVESVALKYKNKVGRKLDKVSV